MKYVLAMCLGLLVLPMPASAKQFDPATATPEEKALVGAAFLITLGRQCAGHESNPEIYSNALADAATTLTEVGFSGPDAEAKINEMKKGAEASPIKPEAGAMAFTLLKSRKPHD